MKNIILVGFIFLLCVANCKSLNQGGIIYWEDLTKTEQENILHSLSIYENAVKYYQGIFKVTDNNSTEELLKKITSDKNTSLETIFYFYIFNQICLKSDGALSETLGEYCMKFMLIDPKFVLPYFQRNKNVEKKYAELMGYEFYFKEEGISDMEYTYNEFKKIIESKIGNNQNYKNIFNDFCNKIEIGMKNMD
jgi:hypothetical protein